MLDGQAPSAKLQKFVWSHGHAVVIQLSLDKHETACDAQPLPGGPVQQLQLPLLPLQPSSHQQSQLYIFVGVVKVGPIQPARLTVLAVQHPDGEHFDIYAVVHHAPVHLVLDGLLMLQPQLHPLQA